MRSIRFTPIACGKDDRPVGIVTSGAYGHRTGKVLALAYLRDATARDGLSVSILGHAPRGHDPAAAAF